MPSDPAYALDREYPNLPRAVADAYRDAPPDAVAEVIAGVFYAMAKPRPAHQSAGGELYAELSPPFRRGRGGPGGWVILPEPELCLGERPDLSSPTSRAGAVIASPNPRPASPSRSSPTGSARSTRTPHAATTSP